MNSIPLPAFQDNYPWVLHVGYKAMVVDPGDAQPVLHCLQRDGLQLEAILVTHRHPGHIGGVDTAGGPADGKACGPARERIRTREYTLGNARLAPAAEPGNLELIHYSRRCEELRAHDLPTLPSAIGRERRIKSFLRTRLPGVVQAARDCQGATPEDDVAVFAAIRQWKNEFK